MRIRRLKFHAVRSIILGASLPFAVFGSADAQATSRAAGMDCSRPAPKAGSCKVTLTGPDADELLAVKVVDAAGQGVGGVAVAVSVAPAAGRIAPSLTTGVDGIAATQFTAPNVTAAITVTFTAALAGSLVSVPVVVSPQAKSVKSNFVLGDVIMENRFWYAERQIPGETGIEIRNVAPLSADCDSAIVKFKAFSEGSAASPDSAFGRWMSTKGYPQARCIARFRWKLGKEFGTQYVRAELSGQPAKQKMLSAVARAMPRLMAGAGVTYRDSYLFKTKYDSLFKVSRVVNGNTIAFDSTVSYIDETSKFKFSPLVGVDLPLWLSWEKTRFLIASNPTNASNEWFVGISFPQRFWGPQREGVASDFQVGLTFFRHDEIQNYSTCKNAPASCTTKLGTFKPTLSIVASFDGVALLQNLITAFPK